LSTKTPILVRGSAELVQALRVPKPNIAFGGVERQAAPADVLPRMAKLFGVTVDDLIVGAGATGRPSSPRGSWVT
jgi:hypothetical protein